MTGSQHAMSSLTMRLFGPFDVRLNREPLPRLRSRKGEWLLALLALRHGGDVERTWLAGTLWPDSLEPQALANLRISLADVRRALGPQAGRLRSPGARTVSLDLEGAEVDVVAFDTAIAGEDLSALQRAIALYRGPLLEGCAEEWVLQERAHREQAYLRALERLAASAVERGEHGAAESYLRRAVAVDLSRETAQRGLMQALAASGNYAAATSVYRELRLHLHRELNAEPDAETRALFEQIRAEARQKAVRGARCAVRGEESGTALAQRPALVPTAHRAPRTAHGSEAATVTFLFTDIAGSTRLWEEDPEGMRRALGRHDLLLRDAIETHHGHVFKTMGDAFCAAFVTAADAVDAALAIQRVLASQTSADPRADESEGAGPLRVRLALHAGEAEVRDSDYFGPALSRATRLLGVAHGGQILLSGATQELVQDTLPPEASLRDLGMQRLRDLQRPERVFQLLHPDLPADFPPLSSLGVLPNNLPQQLTSFVGRERDITKVKRMLAGGPGVRRAARLLTLTGVGGTGKTRLALQVAAELLDGERDGVWLVELAPLADPALVPEVVASVLGIREELGKSVAQRLVEGLQPKKLLLLLDNCEHLLSACAELADLLLRGCPEVQILATSREALGIAGEQTYVLPSLSLPEAGDLPARPEDLAPYEATRLFVDRAMASQATFAVTASNAGAVVQICRRLDGIPLAIELAAARVKALPVEKINERLDDRFRLLTGGSRTALPRQQTLRALIDWSYDLLTEGERALLRRLSVFAASFTLEAAEAVGADPVDSSQSPVVSEDEGLPSLTTDYSLLPSDDVVELLTRLVEKSLIQYEEESGTGRYRLLETVRQYARDRLLERGEDGAARERHGRYYLQLAEEAEPHLRGPEQVNWLARLEAEQDNLRTALAWYHPEPGGAQGLTGDADAAVRLVGAFWLYWIVRSQFREGRHWLESVLSRTGRRPSPGGACGTPLASARARALVGAGHLAFCQGDYTIAREFLEQALATAGAAGDTRSVAHAHIGLGLIGDLRGDAPRMRLHAEESLAVGRALGDPWSIAWSHYILAQAFRLDGNSPEAERYYGEGLRIFREIGEPSGAAWSLMNQASLFYFAGDAERSLACVEESEALFRALGQRWGIAWCLWVRGAQARDRGEVRTARGLLEEALGLFRDLGDRMGATVTRVVLGHLSRDQDDPASAYAIYTEALTVFRETESYWGCVHALNALAVLAKQEDDLERAARLWGAAAALRETACPSWSRCAMTRRSRRHAPRSATPRSRRRGRRAGRCRSRRPWLTRWNLGVPRRPWVNSPRSLLRGDAPAATSSRRCAVRGSTRDNSNGERRGERGDGANYPQEALLGRATLQR
jgi:predicted ATPase/class 3 adenylate cyclase